ncbi:hypothetical protein [Staphylococcus pasteuri]|uniref:hypothetical protein n=1 Tax=Staphylococcus pasteuri TaxID=45972 RepID=UPI0015E64B84|nr:hypothetical protein [Staphylococcus pasteuri]MEB7433345.1 hypothetical protein [Staphylococcus pasteuri]
MATFKVLADCNDKKTNKSYKQNEEVEATVKEINDFEKRLEKAGHGTPFFERLDNK